MHVSTSNWTAPQFSISYSSRWLTWQTDVELVNWPPRVPDRNPIEKKRNVVKKTRQETWPNFLRDAEMSPGPSVSLMGRPYLVSALCSISKPMPRGKTSMLEVRDSGGTSYHVRANAGPAAVLTREWPLSPRPPTCRHLVTTESMRAPKIPQASWVGRGGQ